MKSEYKKEKKMCKTFISGFKFNMYLIFFNKTIRPLFLNELFKFYLLITMTKKLLTLYTASIEDYSIREYKIKEKKRTKYW